MIENIRVVFSEPDWLLVCDEVYLMTFISECFSEFRGQDTATAKCRITNNSNPHVLNLLIEVKKISQHDTTPVITYSSRNKQLCLRFCLVVLFFYLQVL